MGLSALFTFIASNIGKNSDAPELSSAFTKLVYEDFYLVSIRLEKFLEHFVLKTWDESEIFVDFDIL